MAAVASGGLGLSIQDWRTGANITIELDRALALEVAMMPVGTRLVVAVIVEDIAFGAEVVAGAVVLAGALELVEPEPGVAVED